MDNFFYNANSFQSNPHNMMTCVIENHEILQVTSQGKYPIGVITEEHQKLIDTTTEYYNKLVELNVIEVELTNEEKMLQAQMQMQQEFQMQLQKSQETNEKLMLLLAKMSEEKGVDLIEYEVESNTTSDSEIS